MKLSKKPDIKLKQAKCPNVHCDNYDKLSETKCIYKMKTALDCIYNVKSKYQRSKNN